ncbi:MAG: biotin--[acetyl-CoA-carboxylase] ligase [Thermoplasmata archaeon]
MGPREFYPEIASTQDRAIELARSGAPEGTRVIAAAQSRGRGRLDHVWVSPPGGVYLSIVLRAPSEHATLLPLALGARLAHELSARYAAPFRVKWPNDVLLAPGAEPARKIGGILVDRVEDAGTDAIVVAGMGVNVSSDPAAFPPSVRVRRVSLAEIAPEPPTLEAIEALVVRSAMRAAIGLRGPGGVEATRALCRRWLWGVGRRATIDEEEAGTITGIGDEGELLLEREGAPVVIRAGEVRVEGTA